MTNEERKQKIAERFIRVQQAKERAWKCHIARQHRSALEQATLLQLSATELMRLLAGED